jgi:hypothetical protein
MNEEYKRTAEYTLRQLARDGMRPVKIVTAGLDDMGLEACGRDCDNLMDEDIEVELSKVMDLLFCKCAEHHRCPMDVISAGIAGFVSQCGRCPHYD